MKAQRKFLVWVTPALAVVAASGCTGFISDPDTGSGLSGGSATNTAGNASSSGSTGLGAGSGGGGPAGTGTFDCKPGASTASAPRVWRLSPPQYAASIQAVAPKLPANGFDNPFEGTDSGERFKNYSAGLGIAEATLDAVLSASQKISSQLLTALKAANPCLAMADDACITASFAALGTKIYRRPLTTDELARVTTLVSANRAALGADGAVDLGVQSLLTSPNFLFRMELGAGNPDAEGRKHLTSYEVASALAFSLTDAPPDDALMAAAAQGTLTTSEQLREHALRLVGNVGENKVIGRFLREYLKYDRTIETFKDHDKYPEHSPANLVADTAAWLSQIAGTRKNFVSQLLLDNGGWARPETASSYNLTLNKGDAPGRVEFPPGQRSGILTQPSFLSGFSNAEENDPIRRGKFIAQSLLCIDLPNTPPTAVPPLPELTPTTTLREKLTIHRSGAAGCPACHNIMDGIGLGLEGFDHLGRFRTTDVNGQPVDTSGTLSGSDNGDGPFNGATELAAHLAASPAVEQCVIRHGFRFFFGRNETDADSCSLTGAQHAAQMSGGDLVEVTVALLSSDSFLYRSVP